MPPVVVIDAGAPVVPCEPSPPAIVVVAPPVEPAVVVEAAPSNGGGLIVVSLDGAHRWRWVAPVTKLVPEKVWIEQRSEQVWFEAETTQVADPCGGTQTIIVREAGWRTVVVEAHCEIVEQLVIVAEGWWQPVN